MPRKRDENETAFDTLEELLRRDAERDGIPVPAKPAPEKMAVRVKAGRKGGEDRGKVRAKKLSTKERVEIAKQAAKTRWSGRRHS
jgi:hypothetical protein